MARRLGGTPTLQALLQGMVSELIPRSTAEKQWRRTRLGLSLELAKVLLLVSSDNKCWSLHLGALLPLASFKTFISDVFN